MGNDGNTKFVRIDRETVEAVEANKIKTGVPVGKYFEQAAKAKLIKDKVYNADKIGGKKR